MNGEWSGHWLWSGVNGNDGMSIGSCKWPKLAPRERFTTLWRDFDHHKMCHNTSLKQPPPNRAAHFHWTRAFKLWIDWPWHLAMGRQITLPWQAAAWFNFCSHPPHPGFFLLHCFFPQPQNRLPNPLPLTRDPHESWWGSLLLSQEEKSFELISSPLANHLELNENGAWGPLPLGRLSYSAPWLQKKRV